MIYIIIPIRFLLFCGHKLMYTCLDWLSIYVCYDIQSDKVRIPLMLHWFARVGCILVPFLLLIFLICANNNNNIFGTNNVIQDFSKILCAFLITQVVCYEIPNSKVRKP